MCTRPDETTARNGGGGPASAGTEMQHMDRRYSEYQMYPYVNNMNPHGFGQYGPQNNMGTEGVAKVPPPGKEAATGAMTPVM